jgi:CxxC-x17-CxxC domain-containing protein
MEVFTRGFDLNNKFSFEQLLSPNVRLRGKVHPWGFTDMSQAQATSKANGEWSHAEPETEFQDRNIRCVDCSEDFIWTGGEQVFFHDKGLKNEPKRCKPCKQAKNERLAAIAAAQASGVRQRIEVSVNCAQCGQQTTVPFYPSQGRPVFCRSCFLAGRSTGTQDAG